LPGRGSRMPLPARIAWRRGGLASSIDFFGENISDPIEADRVTDHYVALAQTLERARENTFLSIDLSHIGLDQAGEAVQQRLERIAAALPAGRRIQVGAEQERRADRILAAVSAVARTGGAVSATIQANLKRSPADAQALAEGGVPIRLVKGAYVEDPQVARPWVNRPTWPSSSSPTSCMQTAQTSQSPPTTPPCGRRSCVPCRASASKCCLACAARTRGSSPPAECPSGSTCPTATAGSATRCAAGPSQWADKAPVGRTAQLPTRRFCQHHHAAAIARITGSFSPGSASGCSERSAQYWFLATGRTSANTLRLRGEQLQLLGIHHVSDNLGGPIGWDLALLVLGAILIVVGLAMARNPGSAATVPTPRQRAT
jgi:hypothetical protein